MKRVSKSRPRSARTAVHRNVAAALALSAAAFGADAAGLGPLRLLSSLGQPLRAEIDLSSVSREEASALAVRLAGADAFSQANVDFAPALSTLRFSIQRRPGGQPYVLVTSNQPVNEPFVDMLVELTWPSGRLVREYTMLLDPPGSTTARRDVEPGATVLQAQAPAAAQRPARATPRPAATPADAAPPAAAAAPRRDGNSYTVQRGDTALSIAREVKTDDVTVDQMVAALYRDNASAFAGNVNRLRAGATLAVPDAAAVKAIDRTEARRTLVAQSDNFGSYSQRVARGAADAPSARSSGSQASGRLTTRVDDAATATPSGDRLQLSKPELKDATTTGGTPALRAGTGAQQSAVDLAAKDREIADAKVRLAQLEKSVGELQQMLALKSKTLADLQSAGAKPSTAAAPAAPAALVPVATAPAPAPVEAAPPPPAPAPAPVAASAPAPAPVAAPSPAPAPAAASGTAPVTAPAQSAPVAPGAEPSFFESLMDNSLLVLAALVLIVALVGYAIWSSQRRRKLSSFEDSIFVDNSVLHPNSVFGTTGGQSVDTANSGFHSNFVPVGGALPDQNEVDPVAEADVYIAYGRDAQAEEILKEALRNDPDRHAVRLKLLEIYAKRGDRKSFETLASELYGKTQGQGDEWTRVAALGESIDPQNPLYRDAHPADASTGAAWAAGAAGVAVAAAAGPERAEAERAASMDFARTDPLPREFAPPAPAPAMNLDLDLGFTDIGPTIEPPARESSAAPLEAGEPRGAGGLDFDVGEATRTAADPFRTTGLGADPDARTAVNLPAFRARADGEPSPPRPADIDTFTASDIFGTRGEGPPEPADESPPEPPRESSEPLAPAPDVFANQFDRTETLDPFAMSKINLELDRQGYAPTDHDLAQTEVIGKPDVWQAMATKLDLAMAYTDIGDKEGARELLEEVVRSGDESQSARARELITSLG